MMTRAVIGGRLFLPYQDDEGNDIPIASGEVVYKMSALSVDGQMIRVPATVIAGISHGVLEPKHLLYGVWTADIRPFSPAGYSKRIKFLADAPEMDLADVIPIPIDSMDVVKGDDGTHIVSIEALEDQGLIRIVVSDGEVFTFPLPHAALSEADRAALNSALESVNAGTATVEELASTLQASVDSTSADLQSNLQALTDGVAEVRETSTTITAIVGTATQARDEATTSASNALGYANEVHESVSTAQGAATQAQSDAHSSAQSATTASEHASAAQASMSSAQDAQEAAESAAQGISTDLGNYATTTDVGALAGRVETLEQAPAPEDGYPTEAQWNALLARVEALEASVPTEPIA